MIGRKLKVLSWSAIVCSAMPKPYSYDFRQKVIQAIELDGLKTSVASELFNISRNTSNLWLQRKAQTGDVRALFNQPRGNNHKIADWEQFRAFAKMYSTRFPKNLKG